jgi:hypothetical protein
MPVFVRSGGIIPEQSASVTATAAAAKHVILDVFPGTDGGFSLYSDSGTGLGYTEGQDTETPITDSFDSTGATGTTCRVTIGAARGHYPGEPQTVSYRIEMVDLTQPSQVTVDGRALGRQAAGSDGPGWSYQAATATVVVSTPSLPVSRTATIVASNSQVVNRPEPAAAA